MRSRRQLVMARFVLALMILVTAGALIWPGPQLFTQQVEPFVMGLPFAFAWNVAWLVLMFFALLAYHLWTGEEG